MAEEEPALASRLSRSRPLPGRHSHRQPGRHHAARARRAARRGPHRLRRHAPDAKAAQPFEIAKPTVSCHEHNEHTRATELIQEHKAGKAHRARLRCRNAGRERPRRLAGSRSHRRRRAGVSDSRRQCRRSARLIASGLPAEEFQFLGFLPEKAGARRTRLEKLRRRAARVCRAR